MQPYRKDTNLRKQWHQELAEKFFLPATILEARSYNQAIKAGRTNPFQPDEPSLVICSYHFARNKAEDIVATPWDLVVIDEAHRLRNVYKPSNVIANTLKSALEGRPKVVVSKSISSRTSKIRPPHHQLTGPHCATEKKTEAESVIEPLRPLRQQTEMSAMGR